MIIQNSYASIGMVPSTALSETPNRRIEQKDEFQQLLKRFDDVQETPEQRLRRKAKEDKASQQRRDEIRRNTELQSRIAHLRSKIINQSADESTAAELSMAKTQLYWLNNKV